MKYAETHTMAAERSLDNLNMCLGTTGAGSCALSRKIARLLKNESRHDSLAPFKGIVVAILFSLPFWLSLTYLLSR